jgi:hypothetical protein
MIDITVSVQEAIRKINRLPKQFEEAAAPVLWQAADKIARIMRRPGLSVRYPITWDSVKQKIFVILKLKREGNLPYQRSGAYTEGWTVTTNFQGAVVSNIGHKAVFLAGYPSGEGGGPLTLPSGQSHIHEGRWRLIRPVVEAVLSVLPKEVLEALKIEVSK